VKTRAAAISFLLLTCGYVTAFALVETRRNLAGLDAFMGSLPVVLSLTANGWAARFLRWQWLLRRSGHRLPVWPSLLSYLAGFAFTATPGKLGELVRMRYFAAIGVPAAKVLSAFVYERACDLLVVCMLAALAFGNSSLLGLAAAFVCVMVGAVLLFALRPGLLTWALARTQGAGLRRLARLIRFLRDGLAGCRVWLRLPDVLLSVLLGTVAWATTSLAMVYLSSQLGFPLPLASGLGIYPLAMLVGAASMLSGGVGTTEATIVTLLARAGVPWTDATLVAVGARLGTLWFAMAAGLLAIIWLEYRGSRSTATLDQARSTE
jgi:uncharacterized protein (TIRG00374 family)